MSFANSASFCERVGLSWLAPLLRLCGGEDPSRQLKSLMEQCGVPLLAIALFLGAWQLIAGSVETSLGALPGPRAVAAEFFNLIDEHQAERAKAAAFAAREATRNAERARTEPGFKPTIRPWTGKRTFFDQIGTSLVTVFTGFMLATLIAVPVGLLCGSSRVVRKSPI